MDKRHRYRALALQKGLNILEKAVSVILYRPKGRKISLTRDIRYDMIKDSKRGKCDFISLKEYGKKRPIFIYIHGGGWVSGLKKMRRFYCYEYADKGYFVVNCDYEYAPQRSHPYQLQQIFKLIDMLYARRHELNIDVNQIVIGGDSAGAYLAAMVAAIVTSDRYEDLEVKCKFRGCFKIIATVLMCGAYNISNLISNSMPGMSLYLMSYCNKSIEELRTKGAGVLDMFNIISNKFPPTFIIKAERDALKSESDKLERLLSNLGIESSCYLATGMLSGHCFALLCKTKQGKECLNAALGFVEDFIKD